MVELVEEAGAAVLGRIDGTSEGLIDAGPGEEAASLELSVDELSLDDRAGGDCFCTDALVVVVV